MGRVLYSDRDGRGQSASVWRGMPEDIMYDHNVGFFFCDDFMHGGGPSGTITTAIELSMGSGYQVFGSANSTVTNAGEVGGAVKLLTSDDNGGTSIQAHTGAFQISQAHKQLWFEARVKVSTITTAEQSFFVGLCEAVTLSATVPLTATGALADQNLVGFHKPEANTTAFDTSYKANSVTAVEVNSDVGTLAADTYINLGMRYEPKDGDPTNTDDFILSFWINGAKQASVYSVVSGAGTDFPNDVVLYPTIAMGSATADDEYGVIDWVQCAQLNA
jgi:hypothetical protein